MLENQYNDGKLNLESKDIVDKAEIDYNEIKDKLKLKVNSMVEYPILALKSEIEELKAATEATKKKICCSCKGQRQER